MAKILLIISAIVIAATAYLGFATKGKVDGLQDDLKTTKTKLGATTTELNSTKGKLKTTEENLTAAKADIEAKDKSIAEQKGKIDGLTGEIEKAKAEIADKTAKLDEVQKQLEKATAGGISIEELGAKLKELTEAKTRLETELAEAKQVNESLNKDLDAQKAKAVASDAQVQAYKQNIVKQGLSGTILAYNPGWNFVVLSIGDRQGLKAGKEMVVTRGGQMIGKVKVTTVEPSSSIADVIPNSIARGTSVQPGDTVIYQGRATP